MKNYTVIYEPDSMGRPAWASTPELRRYYDEEWSVPTRDDRTIFARLCLLCFQAGLTWQCVLEKRPTITAKFRHFDPLQMLTLTLGQIMGAGMINNPRKIAWVLQNAHAYTRLAPGELGNMLWEHAPDAPPRRHLEGAYAVPAYTAASAALAQDLREKGFRGVGPTNAYALMQWCGVVDDNPPGSWRALVADKNTISEGGLLLAN
ncbi:MAG: DNA-3-methyladenine glycosylase I [Actinomycetaceae bacterium]|nr:DNA-3-methyladenine glycosylase I [Actinomycetaceae bacterium]